MDPNLSSFNIAIEHMAIFLVGFRIKNGDWLHTYLVGGLEHDLYFSFWLGNVIIPVDFHIFQRGGSTTNQFRFGVMPQRIFDELLGKTWENMGKKEGQLIFYCGCKTTRFGL